MENKIQLTPVFNSYLMNFQVAQFNLSQMIEEERLRKRVRRSRKQLEKAD